MDHKKRDLEAREWAKTQGLESRFSEKQCRSVALHYVERVETWKPYAVRLLDFCVDNGFDPINIVIANQKAEWFPQRMIMDGEHEDLPR